MYYRNVFKDLIARLKNPRLFLQILSGPRQVGKTTLAQQIIKHFEPYSHYATADDPALRSQIWIEEQWNVARLQAKKLTKKNENALLVLDEVQKIPNWSEVTKKLWDEDALQKLPLQVVLLGSSPLLMQKGLAESLTGRFEITPITHWSYKEMQEAFGVSFEQYVFFGGYPGARSLIEDETRWRSYIRESIVETTLSRDILLMTRVEKPALLRQLFDLASAYSGQILSYQKMIGQLHDAGNTTTLAHYLKLLGAAGLISGIEKYSGSKVRQKASSPKLCVLNTALMSSKLEDTFQKIKNNPSQWGRLIESSVGAHIQNSSMHSRYELYYWREGHKEIDYVLKKGAKIVALEVKSGISRTLRDMDTFSKHHHPTKKFLVGEGGIPIETFLSLDIQELFS